MKSVINSSLTNILSDHRKLFSDRILGIFIFENIFLTFLRNIQNYVITCCDFFVFFSLDPSYITLQPSFIAYFVYVPATFFSRKQCQNSSNNNRSMAFTQKFTRQNGGACSDVIYVSVKLSKRLSCPFAIFFIWI